jgi:hypothetical protein
MMHFMGREGLRAHIAVLRAKAHRVRFDLQSPCAPVLALLPINPVSCLRVPLLFHLPWLLGSRFSWILD